MTSSITSDIWGVGYGSIHRWEKWYEINDKDTPSDRKQIQYKCKVCNIYHNHFFDVIPNVFDSMKQAMVPKDCNEAIAENYCFRYPKPS